MTPTRAPARSVNLIGDLTRQIARVAVIGERYRRLDGTPGVNVAPAIHLIDRALETAHDAAASGDALTVIRSLRHLQDFEDLP